MQLDELQRRARTLAHNACPRCTGDTMKGPVPRDASGHWHSTKCDMLARQIVEIAVEYQRANGLQKDKG